MRFISQNVISSASEKYHNMCGALEITKCDNPNMEDSSKNGGPNNLSHWRNFRDLTQSQLAEKVGTTQNMIGYLESGERGLSAKWLRRLAPALNTTPGLLLDHNPFELPSDIIEIWATADLEQRKQLIQMAEVIVPSTGGSLLKKANP